MADISSNSNGRGRFSIDSLLERKLGALVQKKTSESDEKKSPVDDVECDITPPQITDNASDCTKPISIDLTTSRANEHRKPPRPMNAVQSMLMNNMNQLLMAQAMPFGKQHCL
jgi:hypothetical protein